MNCDYSENLTCRRCGHLAMRLPTYRQCPAAPTDEPIPRSQTAATVLGGPGTELKFLLSKIGITASPDCKCNQRARYLDEQGCDWAEANIEEIVGWLRESAGERGLPFLDAAGRLLVRRAIANARREEARRGKEAASQAEGPPVA